MGTDEVQGHQDEGNSLISRRQPLTWEKLDVAARKTDATPGSGAYSCVTLESTALFVPSIRLPTQKAL